MSDKHRVPEGELSDSEDEGDNRRDQRSYRERSSSLTRRRDKPVTVTPYIPNPGAFEEKNGESVNGNGAGQSMMDVDESSAPAQQGSTTTQQHPHAPQS